MIPRRFDSLFLRLMLAQMVLVGCSLLIFGVLLVIERNELVAPQFAERWAPWIGEMARSPQRQTWYVDKLGATMVRQGAMPQGLALRIKDTPAIARFIEELAHYDVVVDDAWMRYEDSHLDLWLHVHVPGAAPVWLSGPVPRSVLPVWATRLTVGLLLLAVVIGLVSRSFARRVTSPLAQLRDRMQSHASTGVQHGTAMQSLQDSKAPPELIEIDKAYHQLAERLQRNERERALLLAGVSHDLRSPLSRIRLAAEMLPESAENAAGVASITRNVDTADRLTASFLEFIRASTVPLNETVDLAHVVQRAIEGFEKSTHALRFQGPKSLPLHQAHSLLIERMVVNLVDNAFKHGGAPVYVELAETDGWATLTVSDSGPGLPLHAAGQLMEAFARGDASRGVPGFGLGLAIAQQIVERMQGEMLFSQGDKRHMVTIRLPFRQPVTTQSALAGHDSKPLRHRY